MRRTWWVLLLAGAVPAQDEGGRDTGAGGRPVVFVRWKRTVETDAVYDAAWKALEPHFGVLSRRRLFDFDGERKRADEFRGENRDAVLAVAFDAEAARGWEGIPVFPVYPIETDRERFASKLKTFRPGSGRIALFGPEESLPGFTIVPCAVAADARGCDLAWIAEGSTLDARVLRSALDAMKIPLVTTSGTTHEGIAALTVRPDPTSLGLDLAAAILGAVRDGAPPRPLSVRRLRVTVDLRAARAAGYEVPLDALARADVVRREP